MSFENENVELIYEDMKERLEKSLSSYVYELGLMRAGRANVHILDDVRVEYYGTETPINQVGNITVPEARMILITVWDQSIIKKVEKALVDANLGVNPVNDGKNLRLIFPAPTEERRKQLVKELKQKAENAKIAMRNVRRDAFNDLKQLKDKKEITEDMHKNFEAEFEKVINAKIAEVDKHTADKEVEIMKV